MKKFTSPNDSLQQQSTTLPSTRSGDQSYLDSTSFGSSRRFLNSSGVPIGGGSYGRYKMDHLERMHADIESTTRKLELEQRRLYKLDQELEVARSEHEAKRERYKVHQSPSIDAATKKAQTMRQLERRLWKKITDLDKLTCENEQLRVQIDQLRKERLILDTMFKQLDTGIKEKGKIIERVNLTMNDDKLIGEEAKQKSHALSKILERERRGFKDTCKRLHGDVKREVEVQKEHERKKRSSELASKSTDGKKSGKPPYMIADEEEAFSESTMHRRILKLSFLNTIQRRHIRKQQKNIEVFEQAFATIKSTTGIHEIEEIEKIFMSLEQRNFSLLTYVNQLNREIEQMEILKRGLENQLKEHQGENRDSAARKSDALSEISQQIAKTRKASKDKDSMVESAVVALAECRPVICSIVKHLKEEVPSLVNAGYEGDVPPMKCPPPDDHEENLNLFLMYIEEALMQFRVCLNPEKRPTPGPSSSFSPITIKPNELPPAHIMGDETDDDLDAGLADRPLSRGELRERAQQNTRKRRKPGVTSKVTHEQKGMESADDNSAVETTKTQAPPPIARDASKETKTLWEEESGLSASQLANASQPVAEESGSDRKDWLGPAKERKK
eukprot:TRINITY_DN68362_c0_g1_i1.p1 TRINITY_DN68362_c0_g1~~TRINITY_DN68362_c0_g1_i1.p1  ORF type:complete len:616 (-),score=138.52 TRINITY_DN68362_c0_g1_i1:325-2172(-)